MFTSVTSHVLSAASQSTLPICNSFGLASLSPPWSLLQQKLPPRIHSCRANISASSHSSRIKQIFVLPADSNSQSGGEGGEGSSSPLYLTSSDLFPAVVEERGESSREVAFGSGSSSSRRIAVGQLTVAVVALWQGFALPEEALASDVQKVVKLKNVENAKLQEALRAAVAGDLENAERLFTVLIEENPNSASVWSNRGSVRLSMERWEDAVEDLTKAVELAPYAPVPFLNRAIAFEALGKYSEAVSDCKTAIENDPKEYAAWFNLGNVESKLQEYTKALDAYERAAILAPGIAGYRLREASMLFQLDRSEEAAKVMQGLVRKYPNYAEARAALAAVLWSENRRSSAEEQYSEATQQEPRFKSMGWVRKTLQWPPGLENALENFLGIK